MHYYQLGSDGTFHREPDWNVDLRDSTWPKPPLSECGQRSTVKNWGTRAYPHCGLPHVTRVRVNSQDCYARARLVQRLSLKRVLGLWRIYGQRLFTTDLLWFIRGEAVMHRRVNQQKYENNLTNRSTHFPGATSPIKTKSWPADQQNLCPIRSHLPYCGCRSTSKAAVVRDSHN